MSIDIGELLDAVGASLSQDGQTAQLNFVRKNGKTAYVQFPAPASASVLLNIERALGQLFEMQQAALKGRDPREFYGIGVRHVEKVQGAVAQGMPVLSFVLKSNVRLDFALDRTRVRELIEWLEGFEASLDKPPERSN